MRSDTLDEAEATFDFLIQFQADTRRTPIEDANRSSGSRRTHRITHRENPDPPGNTSRTTTG